MFKLYLATLLGFCSLSFSEEITTTYINQGNNDLLLGLPEKALENFEKAQENENSLFEKFLIAYGKIIAYDQLGNREACERTIGLLCLEDSASQLNDDFLENPPFIDLNSSYSNSYSSSSDSYSSSYSDSYSYFSDSDSSDSSSYFPIETSEKDDSIENHSNKRAEKFLEQALDLLKTAPSLDVQKLLFLLIDAIGDFSDEIS